MAYLGSTPTSQNFTSGTDYFSGTGSQTAYTLTRTVNSVNDIEVVINNVVQQPSTAYTLSGTTITFTSAPSSGTNNIYVRYLATNMQSFTVPANSITRTQLDSNLQAGFQGRNRIINGHMVVDQRNAGASVTGNDGIYPVDRFFIAATQSSKMTTQQNAGSVTTPVGFPKYLGITSSAATTAASTDYYALQTRIEGFNTADFAFGTSSAKTVTLSFKVYSSLTGTFGGAFVNGSFNRSYPFTYTISSANTWTDVSITITGDTAGTWVGSTNGIGAVIYWNLGSGSNYVGGTTNSWNGSFSLSPSGVTSVVGTSGATFYITGVQLEEGTTATSFERESYSVTLQKCQRYFEKFGNPDGESGNFFFGITSTTASTAARGPRIDFKVTKRAVPTMALVGSLYYLSGPTWSSIDFSQSTTTQCVFPQQVITGGSGGTAYTLSTTSGSGNYITASAEL